MQPNRSMERRAPEERHVRTNLTIASSGKFKNAVLQLAMQKNMSISEFVRHSLADMYPRLKQLDSPSEYALKRNPRLRQLQEQRNKATERTRTASSDDEIISFNF